MTVTVGQCVAFDGLIQPEAIPGHQLNADKIVSAATSARTLASNLTGKADEVSTAWRALPSVFTIPDGEPMYGAMDAPSASLEVVAGRMVSMAGILEDYASTVTPIKTTLSDIKTRAHTFVNSLEPGNTVWMSARSTTTYQWDANASAHSLTGYGYGYATAGVDTQADTWHSVYDAAAYLQGRGETTRIVGGRVEILVSWLESGEHVGINNDLMDEVADAFALLSQAEAECANAINALREDACLAEVQAVEAWQLKQEGTELPWGAKVEEERNCGEQVGNGFVQFGKGTVEGLGSLISYNPITGEWGDWDFALDSWAGIGDTVVALSTVTASPIGLVNMAVNGPEAYGESLTTMTELGKSLVAWDTWEDAPAQAGTETVLNIATMFIPVGGWAAGTIKGLSKAAGLTRVTSAITRIEGVTTRITSHLLPDLNRLDTPRVHLDVDTPSVKPDVDTPRIDTPAPRIDAETPEVRPDPDAPVVRPDTEAPALRPDTDGPSVKPDTDTPEAPTPGGHRPDSGDQPRPPTGGTSSSGPIESSDSAILDFAQSHSLSNEQLHDLRRTPVDDLTADQVATLKELRELIPAPTPDTAMVKVVPLDTAQKYLSGEYDAAVRGFVARATDIEPQGGLSRVVEDLRLDYDGSPYTAADAKGYAYIEFTTPDAARIDTPYSQKFGGSSDHDQPFTGNGFVGNTDGTWRPEYEINGGAVSLSDGAKLWQVGPDGPRLVGVLERGSWSVARGVQP
ncbi:hypothetical protein [Demequina sp. NBRC 110055]|uniref:hypothetical protein n=1 Tax=Demequina sp. NBRC 110055 TaxID=1570344 RepID=UPI000A038DF5|nr:hypothetical protein [Demequina sp. NBRC 110055]